MSAGFHNITFHAEQFTDFFDPRFGTFLGSEKQDLAAPSGLNLIEGSAALVHDTSVFGATSPLVGRRWRLEASPTGGTINYTGILADFREYVMPVRPFTIALRAMHYGRYGSGGEDPRFQPLFLGYPSLVRGYDFGSFDAAECLPSGNDSCPVFSQLEGSRILVGNAELRFPLLGFIGRGFYGPFPLEGALFADTGAAWVSGQKPKLFGGDRELVSSVGAAVRANVLGFLILEVDYVHPLDRPNKKGWMWEFNFTPGF
jgi:outer membrane protein assembly factor BamA